MSTASAAIVIPVPGRDAYTGGAHAGRTRDSLRAPSIDAIGLGNARAGAARQSAPSNDRRQQPREIRTGVVHSQPQGAIPFLAQQLAQSVSSQEQDDRSEAMPSVRIAARQAYATARDSTVEFLSPTSAFDLRV